MRKILLILIAVAAAAVVAAATLRLTQRDREWTTSSPAALQAFEQGLAAEKRVYWNEAREHFARAVELDPEFAIARLKLLMLSAKGHERADLIRDLVKQTDLERLSPRERLLIQYRAATLERDLARADALVDRYLEKNPNDLFALTIRCDRVWGMDDLDAAERCYTKVLELDPNWVLAQNHLGYIRMAKGEFALAEEAFASYGRIAPDQANPHDSLGELLMLTGRYGEAAREFEKAIAIRSDFCASWSHMIDLAILQGDLPRAEQILTRARSAVCPPEFIEAQQCRIAVWTEVRNGRPGRALSTIEPNGCSTKHLDCITLSVFHSVAVAAGADEMAAPILESMRVRAEPHDGEGIWAGMHAHLLGRRLASEGSRDEAIEMLRRVDVKTSYNGDGIGLFKLYNQLVLASVLDAKGSTAEAADLRAKVDAVNPRFAEAFGPLAAPQPPRLARADVRASR